MKYAIAFMIAGILLIAGAWFWPLKDEAKNIDAPPVPQEIMPVVVQGNNAVERVAEEASITQNAPLHPVSLPAYFDRTFDGRDLILGQVLTKNEAYTRYHITYKSGSFTISGIMNVPIGDGPFPVLILNHGHIDTSVYTNGRGLKREQDYLSRRGYVVLHPDYRNHAQSDKDPDDEQSLRPGYTEDVINAVYAVRNSGLLYFDTAHIGMLGHSMGGGIAQNIAVIAPNLVDAIVLFAPVSADYVDNFNKWTRGDAARKGRADEMIALYGSPEHNPGFWRNMSPINFFDRVHTPILLHHGTEDESCALSWSARTADALRNAGKDITYHEYPSEPHEFINVWPQVMQRTAQFLDQYLKESISL